LPRGWKKNKNKWNTGFFLKLDFSMLATERNVEFVLVDKHLPGGAERRKKLFLEIPTK
jgi:hypothetical protein